MASYDHDAVIVALAARASMQVKSGIKELHAGNLLGAEVFLNAAAATMNSLELLIADAPPVKPLRVLAIVGPRDEDADPLPSWMGRKANDGGDGAA
jgi:hypothetical protein